MSSRWLYFGCDRTVGHRLFEEGGAQPEAKLFRLERFDGTLAPQPDGRLYVAAFHRLESIGFCALSWWDRTVDRRPGSNSIVFARDLGLNAETMLLQSPRRFPWVFERMPQPLTLAEPKP